MKLIRLAAVGAYAALLVLAACHRSDAQTQPGSAQDTIEKAIGSLVVANAQCSGNLVSLSGALEQARKELAVLKDKYDKPAAPQDPPPGDAK